MTSTSKPSRRAATCGAARSASPRCWPTTAARHTITASETAYDLLSSDFLFRPRGSYFLPETGTMRTFVLVGRI